MKDSIIQVAVDLIKLTFIISLYLSFSLCPSHLGPQNNLKEIKQDGRKAACCNVWGKKKMDKHWYLDKSKSIQSTICGLPKLAQMKTFQAIFSADVTGFSHMILITVLGILQWKPQPCAENSLHCFISSKVINSCFVNVVLLNSQCTFILSNPLLDLYIHI